MSIITMVDTHYWVVFVFLRSGFLFKSVFFIFFIVSY